MSDDDGSWHRAALELLRAFPRTGHPMNALQAAATRGDTLDHVLLSGPPGLGKTSLARILSRELGTQLHGVSGPALERKDIAVGETVLVVRRTPRWTLSNAIPRPSAALPTKSCFQSIRRSMPVMPAV